MAKTYYDHREGREKTIPNCAKHGLVWNPKSQRCEKRTGLGFMDEEYYSEAYLFDGGGGGNGDYGYGYGYYDGGGGYYDYGAGLDTGLYLQPGQSYEPIDYAPGFELLPQQEPQFFSLEPEPAGSEFFYDPSTGDVFSDTGGSFWEGTLPGGEQIGSPEWPSDVTYGSPYEDIFYDYLDAYLNMGYDIDTAITLAEQDRARETIFIPPTEAEAPLPNLPPMTFPYIPSPWDPWQTPPIIPPIEPIPPAPPAPQLPGYCPAGTYHPISDPFACVPFPSAPATQTPRPPTQQPQTPRPPASQTPRPPTQQQQQPCPTGYCKHPTTGQCMPIPQGYVRHPQTQVCTAQSSQVSPLPIPQEAEDMFADLKKLPWWIWAGLGGVLLLSRGGRR